MSNKQFTSSSSSSSSAATRRIDHLAKHLSVGATTTTSTSTTIFPDQETSAWYGDVSKASTEALALERSKASFPIREMMHFLNGSEHYTHIKEKVYHQLEEVAKIIPSMRNDRDYEVSTAEDRVRTVERIRAIYRLFMGDQGDPEARQARIDIAGLYDPAWLTRNGIHFGLFAGAIQSNGSDAEIAEWVPQLFSLSMYGCFGMTELGHGSFVRGIETTATFIPGVGPDGDGEWDIHTPSLTASKWWIGGLGETSTHCALYARLRTKGEDYGVHVFLIPIRDMTTHRPLPNIRIGDIGPKFGRNGIDNGWIQFHHARYPRSVLLTRHAKVLPDGTYVRNPQAKPQLAYGALVMGRATMVSDSANTLQLATTIAVRWAALRRQGAPIKEQSYSSTANNNNKESNHSSSSSSTSTTASSEPEPQILDYVTHQARLMPLLATSVAFVFTAARMREMYDALMAGLDNEDVSALPDVHATSAGLKAFCTWTTHLGIDTCRQCMGGHGYSKYSRLPSLFADFAVMCTWEGDNTVMALQTSRYLINSLTKARLGQSLAGSVTYLTDKGAPSGKCNAKSLEDLLDINTYLNAMRWRARTAVINCYNQLEQYKKGTATSPPLTEGEAWNAASVQLLAAAKAHVYYNITSMFAIAVARRREQEEAKFNKKYTDPYYRDPAVSRGRIVPTNNKNKSATAITDKTYVPVTGPLYPILKALCDLFALSTIQDDLAAYIRGGYFTAAQATWIETAIIALNSRVRKDAVPIVDSFGITDFVINSPMGRYDGDVYRHYFSSVQAHGAGYQGSNIPTNGTTLSASSGPPALIGGNGKKQPTPYEYKDTPYFEQLLVPMLNGEDLASGPFDLPSNNK